VVSRGWLQSADPVISGLAEYLVVSVSSGSHNCTSVDSQGAFLARVRLVGGPDMGTLAISARIFLLAGMGEASFSC